MVFHYIPTHHQLLSFVLYGIQHLMYPISDCDKDMTTVDVDVCGVSGNVSLHKNAFTVTESRYIISKILGWEGTL